jgi:hypothetical protein
MNYLKLLVGIAAVGATSLALADTVTVFQGDPSWGNPPSENGNGTGKSFISATEARSGNGSLELFGDRTRFVGLGNFYSPASNLGLLKDVTAFTFEWSVAVGSTQGTTPEYSPALRLHIWDGTQRSELFWENAYNGTVPVNQGTWHATNVGDNFGRYQAGIGDSGIYNRSISQWATLGYSANAYVSGVSIGVGSSAGAGYHAFADNVTLAFGPNNSTTYNFEVATPAVPDSVSSFGAILLGLAALLSLRGRLAKL